MISCERADRQAWKAAISLYLCLLFLPSEDSAQALTQPLGTTGIQCSNTSSSAQPTCTLGPGNVTLSTAWDLGVFPAGVAFTGSGDTLVEASQWTVHGGAPNQTVVFRDLALLSPALPAASADTPLMPPALASAGVQVAYDNVTLVLPSCTDLSAVQSWACAAAPTPSILVQDRDVMLSHLTLGRTTFTSLTVTCRDMWRTTTPLPERDPEDPQATPSPPCLSATVSTGAQLMAALHALATARPKATNTTIWIVSDVSLRGLGLPIAPPADSPVPVTPAPVHPDLVAVTNTLHLRGGAAPAGGDQAAAAAVAAGPLLQGGSVVVQGGAAEGRHPELDLAGVFALLSPVGADGRVMMTDLVVSNAAVGPDELLPYSLVTAMMYTVGSGESSSLSPLGGGGRRLTLTNVTLLVPSDEFSWWRWWFSRTSNTTSTSTAVGPGWVTGSLMDSSWAAPTVSDTNLHWAHAQGHQRSWAWSDVVIADRAGPEPPPSAFPPVWPLSGLSLITGYAAAQAVSAGDLVPLTLYSLLIQLDPTDLRTGPAPAAPTLTPDVLHNFLYVWSAALDPQEFAATPPSMARSSALMGQPVRPRTTVLDLAGCPPSVNILPGAVFSLMHLVLAGAPPSPRAAVCGAAARAAGIVTSAPWPAGCPAAEDGVRLSAWRALGLPDVSGPGFVNGTQVAGGEVGEVGLELGGFTALLWSFTFPRTAPLTPTDPISLYLYNVTLLVPDLEMRALLEVARTGTTAVAISGRAQALLRQALELSNYTLSASAPQPSQNITFTTFTWFSIRGAWVTIASYPVSTLAGAPLPDAAPSLTTRRGIFAALPTVVADAGGPLLRQPPPPPHPVAPTAPTAPAAPAETGRGESEQSSRSSLLGAVLGACLGGLGLLAGLVGGWVWCSRKGGRCAGTGGGATLDKQGNAQGNVQEGWKAAMLGGGAPSHGGAVPCSPRKCEEGAKPGSPTQCKLSVSGATPLDAVCVALGTDPAARTPCSSPPSAAAAAAAAASTFVHDGGLVGGGCGDQEPPHGAITPLGAQALAAAAAAAAGSEAAHLQHPSGHTPADPRLGGGSATAVGMDECQHRSGTGRAAAAAGTAVAPQQHTQHTQHMELAAAVASLQADLAAATGLGACGGVVLTRELGRGTYGTVYQGTWRGLRVAVKRLVFSQVAGAGEAGGGGAGVRAALHEAALNASLSHPNVVATYSYDMRPLGGGGGGGWQLPGGGVGPNARPQGITDWQLFIIQEFCDGGSLYDALVGGMLWDAQRGAPHTAMALNVLLDVAAGLHYLHSRNILHGDLKPDNVLLKSTPTGMVTKLADFGMSTKLRASQSHVSGVRHGTPLYIAPEVAGAGRASAAADVYALGVMAWELVHGLSAWDALMAAAKAGRTHLVKGVQYVPGLLTWDVRASGSNCQSAPSHDFAICTNTSDTANGTSVTAAPDAAAAPAACGGPAGAALAHSNGAAPPQPPPSSALEALARLGDSCMDVDPRRRPTAAAVLDALYAITALAQQELLQMCT